MDMLGLGSRQEHLGKRFCLGPKEIDLYLLGSSIIYSAVLINPTEVVSYLYILGF